MNILVALESKRAIVEMVLREVIRVMVTARVMDQDGFLEWTYTCMSSSGDVLFRSSGSWALSIGSSL